MIRLYMVGGCVRDKFVGRNSKDIDYCVEASNYGDMIMELKKRGAKILYEKKEYLTVKALYNDIVCDFVLCRKDGGYLDKRRPDTVEMGDIKSDLARRDFTMNAIAEDEFGKYIDPFNGIDDIKNKIIRCVGGIERIKEDSLRILRAIRFLITLPDFKLDQELEKCMNDISTVELLEYISTNRIREELGKCFTFNTIKTLDVLNRYPLIINQLFKNQILWLKPTLEKKK